MPVTLASCLGLTSDALGACPHDYIMFNLSKLWGSLHSRIRSNLSKTKNIPPKALIFSDFLLTFAMSLMILLVFKRDTKVSEKSDMVKSWAIFCCSGTYKNS